MLAGKSGSMVAWICWSLWALFLVVLFAWMFMGLERIVLDRAGLAIHHELGRFHRKRWFALSRIHDVRIEDSYTVAQLIMVTGKIAVDYDTGTYRFAACAGDDEAAELSLKLSKRLAELQSMQASSIRS